MLLASTAAITCWHQQKSSFLGLIENDIREFGWMDVDHWASMGGSELGTNRHVPVGRVISTPSPAPSRRENRRRLLIIGGWAGYTSALHPVARARELSAFDVPIICLPATISNNLPGGG